MMDRATGQPIDTMAHIRQSISDILTTPIGSRVMRRDYGSRLFDLVDAPGHPAGALRAIAAAADAVTRWERRVSVQAGRLAVGFDGRVRLRLEASTTADASPLAVEVPL